MKDLNFFEPYIEKREFRFTKITFLYLLLVLVMLVMAGLGAYNQLAINSLKKQVASKQEAVNDPKTAEKVAEIKELEAEVMTFREEVEKVIKLDESIELGDYIDKEFVAEIRSKMPADMFLTSMSIQNRDLNISGISRDTYSVAEFAKGLSLMEETESVFISNITANELSHDFQLNMTLKEVSVDGDHQEAAE